MAEHVFITVRENRLVHGGFTKRAATQAPCSEIKRKLRLAAKQAKWTSKNKGSFPFPMTDRDMKQYQESKIQATVPNIPCVRILLPTRP
jgi:hypothetical protein